MAGETKSQLLSDGRLLMVSCDKAEFAKIMQAVCDSIGCTEPVDKVVDLRVTDYSQWQQTAPASRLRDKFALVGCAIFGSLFLFVFVLGILGVIEMFSK